MSDKKDLISSSFMLCLGLFLIFKTSHLSIWSRFGPGEGFFPLSIGVVIIGLSSSILIRSLLRIRSHRGSEKSKEKYRSRLLKLFYYGVLLLLYSLLIEPIGFLVTSLPFLIILLRFVEKQSWRMTILAGFSSIIISYILFVYLLGVSLPKGLLRQW